METWKGPVKDLEKNLFSYYNFLVTISCTCSGF